MKRILSFLLCLILISTFLPLSALAEGEDEVCTEEVSEELSTPAQEEPQTPAEEPAEKQEIPAAEEPAEKQEIPASEEPAAKQETPASEEPGEKQETPATEEPGEKQETPASEEPAAKQETPAAEEPGEKQETPAAEEPGEKQETPAAGETAEEKEAPSAEDGGDEEDADSEEKADADGEEDGDQDADAEDDEEEDPEETTEDEELESRTVTVDLDDTTLTLTGEMPLNARAVMDRAKGGEKLDTLLDVTIAILRERTETEGETEDEAEPAEFQPVGTLTVILSDPLIREAREQELDLFAARLTETGVEILELLDSEPDSVKFETESCGEYIVAARRTETIETWETEGLRLTLSGYGFTADPAEPELEEGLTLLRAYELRADSEFRLLRLSLDNEMELDEKESVDVYSLRGAKLGARVDSPEELESSFAVVLDSGLRRQTLEDGPVTLVGLLPVDAEMTSQDVLDNYSDFTAAEPENEEASVTSVAAFDITILNEGEAYEPDEGVDVTIDLGGSVSEEMLGTLRLWHVLDDGSVEEVTEFTVENGQLRFEAGSFSDYVLTAEQMLNYLCRTKNGDGEILNYYTTIQTAYQNVPSGGAIEMLDDVTLTAQLSFGSAKTVTLTTAGDYRGSNQDDGRAVIRRGSGFTNNSLFSVTNGTLKIKDLILDGSDVNATCNGGLVSISNSNASVILDDRALLQNSRTNHAGGAVYVSGGALTMESGSVIRNCVATNTGDSGRGGGIYVYSSDAHTTLNDGCLIENCAAYRDHFYAGGGVCVVDSDHFVMNGGTIRNCSAPATTNKGGSGGGIGIDHNDTIQIHGGLIIGCWATNRGGAMECHGTADISGGTITGNCSVNGGGINFYNATNNQADATGGNEAIMHVSGSPYIYGNWNGTPDSVNYACNVDIQHHYTGDEVTRANIRIKGGEDLNGDAKIGVFAGEYEDQGRFGIYHKGDTHNHLSCFVNDRDPSLVGADGGPDTQHNKNSVLIWAQGVLVKARAYVTDPSDSFDIAESSGRYSFSYPSATSTSTVTFDTASDFATAYKSERQFEPMPDGGTFTFAHCIPDAGSESAEDILSIRSTRIISGAGSNRKWTYDNKYTDASHPGGVKLDVNDTIVLYYQIDPICKLTDDSGNLLYLDNGNPAVFGTVNKAAEYLSRCYTDSGSRYTGALQLKMLKDSGTLTKTLTVPAGKTLTITTADPDDARFPYRGSESTAVIVRGFTDGSLIDNRGSLHLGNITLDGDKSSLSGEGNGGLVYTAGSLFVGSDATLRNSEISGLGAAVYVAAGGACSLSGGSVTGNVSDSANGGAIYLATGSRLNISGSPSVDGNSANGTACDVVLENAGSADATEIHLAGDLSAPVRITALSDYHRQANQQFAVNDGQYSGFENFINQYDTGLYGTMRTQDSVNIYWKKLLTELSVTNTVTGAMGDTTQDFSYTLHGPANRIYSCERYAWNGTDYEQTSTDPLTADGNGDASFTLRHGEKLVLIVPTETDLRLTQTEPGIFTTALAVSKSAEGDSVSTGDDKRNASFRLTDALALDFTNTFSEIAPTGVNRNSAPYLAMLVLGATIALTPKALKRRKDPEEEGDEDPPHTAQTVPRRLLKKAKNILCISQPPHEGRNDKIKKYLNEGKKEKTMKKMKSVLALALTLVLALSLSTVAFAAAEPISTTTFAVNFNAADGVSTPAVRFGYTLAVGAAEDAAAAVPADGDTPAQPAKPAVKAGVAGGAFLVTDTVTSYAADTVAYAKFEANDTEEKTVTVQFDATQFSQPGIYRYIITQNELTDEQAAFGISTDGFTQKYLDVYVVRIDSALKVTSATLHRGTDVTAKQAGFNNYYSSSTTEDPGEDPTNPNNPGGDPTGNDPTSYTVTVKKLVDGAAADQDQLFDFDLTLGALPNTEDISFVGVTFKYSVNSATDETTDALVADDDAEGLTATATVGGLLIAHNQTIVLKGLPKGLDVTAHEDELDYSPATKVEGMDNNGSTTTNTASDTVVADGGVMTFTNTRETISNTGVVMRVAPYVIILSMGMFLMLVALRRKEDEEA